MTNPAPFFAVFALAISLAHAGPAWDNLRVHFGINPLASGNFKAMPRTTTEAGKAGFYQASSCNASNGFLGHRYLHRSGDRSVMLLFDAQGTIAGIQTSIPKSSGVPNERMKTFHNVYLDEGAHSALTAYFVEPSSICSKGRPSSALTSQGTGDSLRFQIGRPNLRTNAVETMEIPKEESKIGTTKWTKGKCFFFMGNHYWYNLRMDMDCDDFFPAFLLYHRGKLNGFGFAVQTNFQGTHYEHPTVSDAKHFFPFIPTCVAKKGKKASFTTVHIYLYNRPWFTQCLI